MDGFIYIADTGLGIKIDLVEILEAQVELVSEEDPLNRFVVAISVFLAIWRERLS